MQRGNVFIVDEKSVDCGPMSSSFVHLHVHSQYSLLEATIRTKKLCERAQKLEMPAVALTDNGNLFGAAEFYLPQKTSA